MEKVTTAAGVRARTRGPQGKGKDDGRWRQEWSNTMVQCDWHDEWVYNRCSEYKKDIAVRANGMWVLASGIWRAGLWRHKASQHAQSGGYSKRAW